VALKRSVWVPLVARPPKRSELFIEFSISANREKLFEKSASKLLEHEMNINHMKVFSQLTGSENVTLEEGLDPKKIISQYKAEYAFDASSYFENIDEVALYRCNETGYRFYYPPGIAGESELYEHLQKLPWYYGSSRWEHDLAGQYITERDNVLEIGCGFGSFLRILLDRNICCAGLELNRRAVETAVTNGLHVYPESIHDHARNSPGKYSVVCAFQVLEHIWSVGDFIGDCVKALKPGGKLVISVPNNNPFLFRLDKYHTLNLPPHHMGLWNKKSLKNLEKVFRLKAFLLKIEPLSDRDAYLKAHLQYLRSRSPLLGKLADRTLQPCAKLLMKLIARIVEGRNLFAIYTKLPDNYFRHRS
jgi:2-polyprenyl-3-methyl-5-hydroxy-6-metoxy-1,4-benzoquinol methylase